MAEATALFGMPGSAVLAAARVAGERGGAGRDRAGVPSAETRWRVSRNKWRVRAIATSEGICAGHGVVPGGEGSARRATSITPESPAKARQIAPRCTTHTPDDPLDKAA